LVHEGYRSWYFSLPVHAAGWRRVTCTSTPPSSRLREARNRMGSVASDGAPGRSCPSGIEASPYVASVNERECVVALASLGQQPANWSKHETWNLST